MYDTLLDVAASRHEYAYEKPHPGLRMFRVKQTDWNDTRKRLDIIERLKEETGDGLGDEFYAVKETFKEDAMTCWKQHNRTKNCDEFKSDRKRLMPDTTAERKSAGFAPMQSNRFLCEFCPCGSLVMQRARAAKGIYDFNE
ncbi:hypothetical protein [Nonomuraea roseoviolacea]|uniref:hypothetical protein n=1 Tax=Nonomuraea roseoviolacea TaxID=103837 RepID=UPI0031D4A670